MAVLKSANIHYSHASAEVRGENTPEKSRLNQGLNSQPPGHESDTLTTEPPGRGESRMYKTTMCIHNKCMSSQASAHAFLGMMLLVPVISIIVTAFARLTSFCNMNPLTYI